jgi:membrane fusion protein (multidrug efflux system)
VLATIVRQNPMYVVFSVPVRTALELRNRMAREGGFDALKVRIRLPDGRLYDQSGKLDFLNNSVAGNTDTLMMRATIGNPTEESAAGPNRELVDGEFVNVLLEGTKPIEVLAIPRVAVLFDQSGDYVYVVDAQNKAQKQPVKLGQSTPALAVALKGLEEGQMVIVDGLQRVRPGQPVSPSPSNPAAELGNKDEVDPSGDAQPEGARKGSGPNGRT